MRHILWPPVYHEVYLLWLMMGCTIVSAQDNKIDTMVRRATADFLRDQNRAGLFIGIVDGSKKYTYHFGEVRTPGDRTLCEIMLDYVQFQLNEKDAVVALCHRVTWGDGEAVAVGLGWMRTTNIRWP